MMTVVNMHSPGLEILATHRVLKNVQGCDSAVFLAKVKSRPLSSLEELRQVFQTPAPNKVRIGIALRGGQIYLYERARAAGELDVKLLHEYLLGELLGIDEEA